MDERMKVLQLLEEGKINAEQAAALLAAMESKSGSDKTKREFTFSLPNLPKKSSDEWKQLANQIKTTVTQHLEDLKKSVDIEDWSFRPSPRTSAWIEETLPTDITHFALESKNGRIRVTRWEGDHLRVQLRSAVRAENADEARSILRAAMNAVSSQQRYELTLLPNRDVGEVTVEIQVPAGLEQVRLVSYNGSIRSDGVRVEDLTMEAHNGKIVIFETRATRMRLLSHNGNVDIQHSVGYEAQSVYATTYNGTIDIDGIHEDVRVTGTAKSHHGRIDVFVDKLSIDYDNSQQRQHARFHTKDASEADDSRPEVQLFCETNNGMVIIRP